MKVVLSEAAIADLRRLRAFLHESPAAAARLSRQLAEAIRSLERFPERGRPTGEGDGREMLVPFGRSVYVLRYVIFPEAKEVVVLRL